MSAASRKLTVRIAAFLVALLLIVALGAQLTACASPAYYWQAARGHLSLMHGRQSIDEALQQRDTEASLAAKLKLAQGIRSFAVNELLLPDNDSYSQFVETGQDAVVWNVVAAPEFSLEAKEWCFAFAGCVPYRGYFERYKAEKFSGKMAAKGMDVSVSPAIAYSTLGWFDDPLLDTMWRYSDAQFAGHVFHELAHQKLYVKGDTAFNEAYASFVEQVGVARWLRARGEEDELEAWRKLEEARLEFNGLLQDVRRELLALYASQSPQEDMLAGKDKIFGSMEERYGRLVSEHWEGRDYFRNWFAKPPNNARFVLLESYQGGECAFSALYEAADRNMEKFHELALERSQLADEPRGAWLDSPCDGIAKGGEL